MKITISSTSMMKPILYSNTNSHSAIQHPQRVLGLLEQTDLQPAVNSVNVYDQPTCSGPTPKPQQWQNFLQIPDSHGQPCAAVFGFKFDGTQTWYQLWNVKTANTFWLLHDDWMDYQPYAIIAMDALVTLVPNWDGNLMMSLKTTRLKNDPDQRQYNLPSNDFHRHCDLRISDAATTKSGQLWFLVTIENLHGAAKMDKSAAHLTTGWISNDAQRASAGSENSPWQPQIGAQRLGALL